MQQYTQWKKRLDVTNVIFDDLLSNHQNLKELSTICFEKLNFDLYQIKIIESYVDNLDNQIKLISENLKDTWTYKRINQLTLAIIHSALSEANLKQVDRKIIIDQALITCNKRGLIKDKKFINAILDKLLPKYDCK